jgi:hypothetical protein
MLNEDMCIFAHVLSVRCCIFIRGKSILEKSCKCANFVANTVFHRLEIFEVIKQGNC